MNVLRGLLVQKFSRRPGVARSVRPAEGSPAPARRGRSGPSTARRRAAAARRNKNPARRRTASSRSDRHLLGPLHALGHHREPQRVGQADHGLDDRPVRGVAVQPHTNARSIFSVSSGSRFRWASVVTPVPKSSSESCTPTRFRAPSVAGIDSRVVHHRRLADLQVSREAWSHAGLQGPGHRHREVVIAELPPRQVHRDARPTLPGSGHPARLAEHPLAERGDQRRSPRPATGTRPGGAARGSGAATAPAIRTPPRAGPGATPSAGSGRRTRAGPSPGEAPPRAASGARPARSCRSRRTRSGRRRPPSPRTWRRRRFEAASPGRCRPPATPRCPCSR